MLNQKWGGTLAQNMLNQRRGGALGQNILNQNKEHRARQTYDAWMSIRTKQKQRNKKIFVNKLQNSQTQTATVACQNAG